MTRAVQFRTVESQALNCPACGYSRVGLANEARCPECGSEGIANCVVLIGVRRTTESVLLPLFSFGLFGIFYLVVRLVMSLQLRPPSGLATGRRLLYWTFGAEHAALLLVLCVGCAWMGHRIFSRRRGATAAERGPPSIVWTIHPTGVEIREGLKRSFVPREQISRIDLADSVIGSVSQVQLIRRASSVGFMSGTTPVMYLKGTKEERRRSWRAARETLGIPI